MDVRIIFAQNLEEMKAGRMTEFGLQWTTARDGDVYNNFASRARSAGFRVTPQRGVRPGIVGIKVRKTS